MTERDPTDKTAGTVGVVLAGGDGSRAGRDKRYLTLAGETLLRRNVEFLRTLLATVAVSVGVGQDLDLGDITDVEILTDAWPGSSPLAGIATALRRFRAPVFALGVDVAFPQRGAARRLLTAARQADVAIPAIGNDREPLFAVYGPRCLEPIVAQIERDEHRIVGFFPAVTVAEVRFRSPEPFFNINTMDDFVEARRRLAAGAAAPPRRPGLRAGGSRPARRDAHRLPALVAIVGKSDSGKTTLIEALLPELIALGLRVGTIKHDTHDFEMDHPGKDSYRHGQAGAEAYVVAAPRRLAFISRLEEELPLTAIAERFFSGFDLVVAEGYKQQAPHRIEVFRRAGGHATPLCTPAESLALVTDTDLPHEHRIALGDHRRLAEFIAARLTMLRVC